MREGPGREVVIVEAARTPIGRGKPGKGYYRDVHPNALLATVYQALIDRSGVDPREVGDVIAGCVAQVGEQSTNIARNAWLQAGLPIEVPAITVDRQCGSAQSAVDFATALIASGAVDVAIGAGVEHMGHLPINANLADGAYGSPFPPELLDRYALQPQGLAAEDIADHWELTRADLDAFGVESQRRAAQATDEGRFEREVIPFTAGDETYVTDEGIRPGTTLEALAALRPAFKPDGKITAGTSSQLSDGAAGVLLMAREKAEALGLTPRARIVDHVTVGSDPVMMLTGPIPATQEILRRNDLRIEDLGRIEINEAFASVVLAWERELRPDMANVNVNGGALALGHPLGSSGARLITTALHELERSDTELGLVTMCTAGGTGPATLIQRV